VSRDHVFLTLFALALATAPVACRAGDLARLDCDNVDAAGVRDVLAHVPAPRVMLIAGSLPFVTMDPFGRFLIAMGYPEASIRDPHSGALSVSCTRCLGRSSMRASTNTRRTTITHQYSRIRSI